MDDINGGQIILIIMFIVLAVISVLITGIILIIRAVKKKSVKAVIIIMISSFLACSLAAGCLIYSEHEKDKWFYEFKSYLCEKYDIITNVEFSAGLSGLLISVDFIDSTEADDTEEVFSDIKEYLFNNPTGENPSQQSYLKRGVSEYTAIYIYFGRNDGTRLEFYQADYYTHTNGWRTDVDNFKT